MKRLIKYASINDIAIAKILNESIEELRYTCDYARYAKSICNILNIIKNDLHDKVLDNIIYYRLSSNEALDVIIKLMLFEMKLYLQSFNIKLSMYDAFCKKATTYVIFMNIVYDCFNDYITLSANKKRLGSAGTAPALQGITTEGKKILQMLENMKFKIEQAARISGNDQSLAQKIMQNSNMIDKIMSGLYSLCFNLDNLDLTPLFIPTQVDMSDDVVPDSEKETTTLQDTEPQDDSEENDETTEETDTEEEVSEESTELEEPIEQESQDVSEESDEG